MNEDMVVDLSRETLFMAIKIITPALAVGMFIGLCVSLFQTITSLQEQTLTLVPKMLSVVLTLIVLLPWILASLLDFAKGLFANLPTIVGLTA